MHSKRDILQEEEEDMIIALLLLLMLLLLLLFVSFVVVMSELAHEKVDARVHLYACEIPGVTLQQHQQSTKRNHNRAGRSSGQGNFTQKMILEQMNE